MKRKLLLVLFASIAICSSAQNTIQVTNLNDSGPGSLRDAIAISVTGDIIDMSNIQGTILLASVLNIPTTKGIKIVGPGKDKLILSGQNATRIFTIATSNNRKVSITGVSLENGRFEDFGGCLFVNGGGVLNLKDVGFKGCECFRSSSTEDALGGAMAATNDSIMIESCQFSANIANNPFGRSVGGALHTQVGYLNITSSTFYNNSAVLVSALSVGPRVTGSNSNFEVINSTFSGNSGSAVFQASRAHVSQLSTLNGSIKNSTFAFNSGSFIFSTGFSFSELIPGSFSFGNCLFNANSTCGPQTSSNLLSLGTNLYQCADFAGPLDLFTDDIVLEPLADNGGSTLTHALKEGTIAVNSGSDPNPPLFDQRGQPRVQNGQIDIGSYESAFFSFSADFTYQSDCNGLFDFQNASKDATDQIVEYLWDFGDGGSSSTENPQHQYGSSGNFVVKLSVKNAEGQTSTIEKEITAEGMPPVINIIGNNPLTLYVNQSFVDPGATAIDDAEGDLTVNITMLSTVVTTSPGTYSVTYRVSDSCGFTSSAVRIVEVIPIPVPSVNLGEDKTLCDGDSLVVDAGSGFSDYDWSTGETSSSIIVTKSGLYIVDVTNQFGFSARDSITIAFVSLPEPVISTEVVPCENALILGVSDFNSYKWSTGSTSQSIKATQSGSYSVIVTNEYGCEGSDKVNVKINSGSNCQPSAISPPVVTAVCSDAPNLVRRWKITNPNSNSLRIDWEIVGTIQKSWIDIPTGDSYLATVTIPGNANLIKVYYHNEKGEKKTIQQASITTKCQKPTASSGRIGMDDEFVTDDGINLKAYPNPGRDQITVEVRSMQETDTPLQIISLLGVVQSQRTIRLSDGSNFIVQDVSNLALGSYIIKVGTNSIRFVRE